MIMLTSIDWGAVINMIKAGLVVAVSIMISSLLIMLIVIMVKMIKQQMIMSGRR